MRFRINLVESRPHLSAESRIATAGMRERYATENRAAELGAGWILVGAIVGPTEAGEPHGRNARVSSGIAA